MVKPSLQFRGDTMSAMSFPEKEETRNEEKEMSGTLISNGTVPKEGGKVVIFVNEVNSPTGIWEGVFIKVGRYYGAEVGISSLECVAQVIDPRAPKEWQNREPHVNYDVKTYEEAFPDLVKAIEEQKQEVKGLKKRMKIERDVLHGALKAMCAPAKSCEDLIFLLKLATKQESDKSI